MPRQVNHRTDRDVQDVLSNDARLYDRLRRGDEDTAWDRYKAADRRHRVLAAKAEADPSLRAACDAALAERQARLREYRELLLTH